MFKVDLKNTQKQKLFKIRVRAEYDHIFEIEDNDLEAAKDQARGIFLKCMNDEVAISLDVEEWNDDATEKMEDTINITEWKGD
jgi:hypothetical protein